MKKNIFSMLLAAALLTAGLSLSSCTKDGCVDDYVGTYAITFTEEIDLGSTYDSVVVSDTLYLDRIDDVSLQMTGLFESTGFLDGAQIRFRDSSVGRNGQTCDIFFGMAEIKRGKLTFDAWVRGDDGASYASTLHVKGKKIQSQQGIQVVDDEKTDGGESDGGEEQTGGDSEKTEGGEGEQ